MRKGCLILLFFCQSLGSDYSMGAADGSVASPANLPKLEDNQLDLLDSNYCNLDDAEIREANYKLDPSTLKDQQRVKVKLKRRSIAAETEEDSKTALQETPGTNKDYSKLVENFRDSSLIGYDDVEKYVDQEEMSKMSEDSEPKDLVKRDVLSADDNEETELEDLEDLDEMSEDTARLKLEGPSSLEENEETNWESSQSKLRSQPENWRRTAGLSADRTELEDANEKFLNRRQYEVELEETRDRNNGLDNPNPSEQDNVKFNSDATKRNANFYNDYEKRAEAEIQRKIDMIKKDIKREIEQKQRLREIEENNAKYDEVRTEEAAEENADNFNGNQVEKVRKRQVKRQLKPIVRTYHSEKLDKRSTVRRKSKPIVKRKLDSKKSIVRKRSALPVKKREHPRQVILVDNAGDTRKKKKKKRKKRSEIFERSSVPGESQGQHPLASSFFLKSAQQAVNEMDNLSPLTRKINPVSLREKITKEPNQRLTPDYNGAFGGLEGDSDPRASLARYKRIKRTLRVPT